MAAAPVFVKTLLFPKEGKTVCRIPSIVATPGGTLLAFSQRRIGSYDDNGHPTEVVLRRSLDNGCNWLTMQTLAQAPDTCFHNGPVVVDRQTGRIFIFYRKLPAWLNNVSEIHKQWGEDPAKFHAWGIGSYLIHSDDEGATWSDPVRIEASPAQAVGYRGLSNAIHGVQMPNGQLVVQAYCWTDKMWGIEGNQPAMSYLLVSDDRGETWKVGPSWKVGYAAMEYAMLVKEDGRLLVNQRTLGPYRDIRTVDLQSGTVSEARVNTALAEPVCHASLCRLSRTASGGKSRILFVNPDNLNETRKYQECTRTRLTVRLSYDDGHTWPVAKVLEEGKAGYADLATLANGEIFCIYENGPDRYDDQISIARFNLAWLTDGEDTL